jgi:ATP-dependent Clp protease ATP-binding subunit ClpA
MSEARELNHSYVGTEHLLLGLLREEKGIAAQSLVALGMDLAAARAETLRLLGGEPARRDAVPRTKPSRRLRPVRFTVQVDYEGGSRSEHKFENVAQAIWFLRDLQSSDPGAEQP